MKRVLFLVAALVALTLITPTAQVIQSGTTLPISGGTLTGTLLLNAGSLGYTAGEGGAVSQLTNRTTGVTLNKITGQITLFSAAGSATAATFTVSDTLVGTADTVILNQASGTNLYELFVTSITGGTSFNVTFFTTGGTSVDAPVINFTILKGSAS